MATNPSSSYKNAEEIKSHSSVLFNQRMAILFWILDTKSITMNTTYDVNTAREVRAIVKQIYKHIRMLLRYNPASRATLNLETKDQGIYVTDVMIGLIDKMFEYCELNGLTTQRVDTIIKELNNFETLLYDVLQYFHYFMRPDFRQKPDVESATEKYKEMAQKRTIDELMDIVGKNHKLDMSNLGTDRVEMKDNDSDFEDDDEFEEVMEEDDDIAIEDNVLPQIEDTPEPSSLY